MKRYIFIYILQYIVMTQGFKNELEYEKPILSEIMKNQRIHSVSDEIEVYNTGNWKDLPTNSQNLSNVIENAIQWLKLYMKTGNKTLNIPKLDPYLFNETNFVYEDTIKLYGEINGNLTNLSDFTWSRVYACLFSMVLQIDLIIPNIQLGGNYNLSGSISDFLPLYGSGNFAFEIENLNVTLTLQFGPQRGDKPIKVILSKVNLNTTPNTKLNFGEIFDDNLLAEIFNSFITDSSSVIIERIIGLLENFFGDTIKASMNRKMTNVTMTAVLDYLDGFPQTKMNSNSV